MSDKSAAGSENIPEELHYTETHEWARKKGGVIELGITAHAAHEVSDIVFVDLPKPGKQVQAKKPCTAIESVKAAFEIFAPVSGTIDEVNVALASKPQLVNEDPYGQGWIVHIKASNPSDWDSLMDAAAYKKHLGAE